MAAVHITRYSETELPSHLKWQILSFSRIIWHEGFRGENLYRDWYARPSFHPVAFVATKGDLLIGHAGVVWKMLKHEGETYKTYGLSGVFTYPGHRRQGHALQLILAATEYIKKQDADIVHFTTTVTGLYEKAGFEKINTKVYVGKKDTPQEYPEMPYMLFLSEKGKRGKKSFEEMPLYFGEEIW